MKCIHLELEFIITVLYVERFGLKIFFGGGLEGIAILWQHLWK
jgi:hypothetical protein